MKKTIKSFISRHLVVFALLALSIAANVLAATDVFWEFMAVCGMEYYNFITHLMLLDSHRQITDRL